MQPIEINVKVTIGMENALLGLISKFTENREAAPEAGPAPKPRKQAKQVEQEPQPKPEVENPQAEAAAPQTAQPAAEPAPAEPAAPASAPAPEPEQREYTEVDVRAAMDEARKRIEGEDYKTNTESEGRKKWHRALTGWFKNTAALYGADKPSELPDSESRRKFIELCAEVRIEYNELTTDIPF